METLLSLRTFANSRQYNEAKTLLSQINSNKASQSPTIKSFEIVGPPDTARAHVASCLLNDLKINALFVAYNEIRARKFYNDFCEYFGDKVAYLPPADIQIFVAEAKNHDIEYERMEALNTISKGDYRVAVISAESLLHMLPASGELNGGKATINLLKGSELILEEFAASLIDFGYERVDEVDGKGQFSIRGGIVDVYSPQEVDPIRIDLFGDEIDSIRTFDIASQRSVENRHDTCIIPAREAAYSYRESEAESIIDYIGDNIIFIDEPARVNQRIESAEAEFFKIYKDKVVYFPKGYVLAKLENHKHVSFCALQKDNAIPIQCLPLMSYQGKYDVLVDDAARWRKSNPKVKIIALADSNGRAEKLAEIFTDYNIEGINIVRSGLSGSYEFTEAGFVILGNFDEGRQRQRQKRSKFKGAKGDGSIDIQSFTDIAPGDYIVHNIHGIGVYKGIEEVKVDKRLKRDFFKIVYRDDGILYVPVSRMDLIQKYIGGESVKPRMNKLGGVEWERVKARVKDSLKKIAEELVKLYAVRQTIRGYAFSRDTVWQKQFEDEFPYNETQDQLKAVEEIKADMENDRPMDRLLCGDVGFGKTEVAIRAMFKAVNDGKQVAYLVPTTVLAQQMYINMKKRFADFPVTVEIISRFKTKKEQAKAAEDTRNGKVDILIGTHRILQKDIAFKNIGLLVVDEEQRFGVGHKEKIKQLAPNVDTLTMTATPIPRTLHMSLSGIRDISTIWEPPEERFPVQTYVLEYNPDMVTDAINREIARDGQIYYLFNRVQTIERKFRELQDMIPEARIAIAHGQMHERELEDTMVDFANGEYDILLCTTIIESGLDIPNVNTIIVENADKMGLAQLYQLRGRVGRAERLAHAYITYKKDKILSEVAEKRLAAIREFTEFGSGFKIALRDLEIRGAGNIIGGEQHGHMDAVGYDTYCRLLQQAIREEQGLGVLEEIKSVNEDVTIDIDINAFIPAEYIASDEQKIQMYKHISLINSEADAANVQDELMDRYGEIPNEVSELINVALTKSYCIKVGIISVKKSGDTYTLKFGKAVQINMDSLSNAISKTSYEVIFSLAGQPEIRLKSNKKAAQSAALVNFLKLIK